MRYVVIEGLPASGKSETLALLARFYPERVKILPELVKEVAMQEEINLFTERERLTKAILTALPRRREQIEEALSQGKLCLEESHLGVHLAYARALQDRSFISVYPRIQDSLPTPDLYLRLEIPIELSLKRQEARGTLKFDVGDSALERMLTHLQGWHIAQGNNVTTLNADRRPSAFLSEVEKILGLDYVPALTSLKETFDILLLLGRPASGKSEFIDFMEKCPLERRVQRYHIAPFSVVDDFLILWEKFEEDDLWERLGRGRLYSRPANGNYSVIDSGIWPFLIGKINHRIEELSTKVDALSHQTLFIEFSRGGEHGYAESLKYLSLKLLSRTAILYVSVSFAESRRRNLARYDVEQRAGILTHSVPPEEMERTFRQDDWFDLAPNPQGTLEINGTRVPYVTMKNEPESTDQAILDTRYRDALDRLYTLWKESSLK
ncbi:TPA: hypothetical protein DIT45_05135 [Candidatus Acetothermia bacterium]|nr:hypothetical protein [Candidatus Acetothermia bacterium]